MDPHEAVLIEAMTAFQMPAPAQNWLIDMWRVFQAFDDATDGDKVETPERWVFAALIGVQVNEFFAQNAAILRPILAITILQWQAANTVERAGNADARSFVWRAGYYNLILAAVMIVHGPDLAGDVAHQVLGLYGEQLPDYLAEFPKAG